MQAALVQVTGPELHDLGRGSQLAPEQVGLGVGDMYVWVRYFFGVAWAAHRRQCPWRLAVFFEWCLHNGLMRQSGLVLEFRHSELLDWYARDPQPQLALESAA
jgi:hypothetical protein